MLSEKTIYCADCGCIIDTENEDYLEINGEYYCQDCMEDWSICDDCGEWFRNSEEGTWVENGERFVCDECLENDYEQCDDCGKYFLRDYMYLVTNLSGSDYYVCDDCRCENYYECADCGNLFHYEDLQYNESDDCDYCNECYPRHENSLLLDYHGFSDWKTYGTGGTNNPITKGFELEVETDNYDVLEEIYDILNNLVVFEHDGSVDGFEMITNPFTREYWKTKENIDNWKDVFDVLNENGCGTCGCGLHVHVNKSSLATDKLSSDDVIDNIILIMETFKNELTKFSRRYQGDLKEWAAFLTDDNEKLTYKLIKDKKGCKGRYTALNLTKGKTIEFRIFNSTMKFNELMATLELVDNIVDIARAGNIDGLTWNDIVTFNGDYIVDYVNDYNITSDKKLEIIEDLVQEEISCTDSNIEDLRAGDFVRIKDNGNIAQIITINDSNGKLLLYKPTFQGHSAQSSFGDEFIGTKYENHLWWYDFEEIKPVIIKFTSANELHEGDRVLVRSDLVNGGVYGCETFVSHMEDSKSKILEVTDVHCYDFLTDYSGFWWFTPKMCEGKIKHEDIELG